MPDVVRGVCFTSLQQSDHLSAALDTENKLWLWCNDQSILDLPNHPMLYEQLRHTKIKKVRLGEASVITIAKEQPFKT